MNNYIEKIYNGSPVLVQNMLISLYGAKLYYERYYKADQKYLTDLLNSQWLTSDLILSCQAALLNNMLSHAYNTVSYYREDKKYAKNYDIAADGLETLRNLPILDKETVRLRSQDLISTQFDKDKLIQLNTSGTTGKSLKVYVDFASRRAAYCFTTRYHRWAGLKDSRHNATFGGRVIIPPNQKSDIFWRYNAAMDNYLFSTYHMSDRYLQFYLEKLLLVRPRYIEAYPSAAHMLAKYIKQNGISGLKPQAVLTSGETLFDHQRDLIQQAFGCLVFDQYGCTEQSLYISQCEKGTYHVHPEYGIVEILDDADNPVGPGTVGRVVCTSFMNKAMPLLRYDIGDTAEWGQGTCDCGRSFPIIKKICGRQDDYLVLPDGKLIGRLDPIFKGVDSVKLAQIVQLDLDNIQLKIIPGHNYNEEDQNKILGELRKRVGASIQIKLLLVDDIPKTSNGKIKAVMSMVKRT